MKHHMRIKTTFMSMIFVLGIAALPVAAQARLSDAMIKTQVQHQLMDQKVLLEDNIQVMVEEGVVRLTGTVSNIAEKQRAEKAALGVDEVARVQNDLSIETADFSDQQIADGVAKQMRSYVFYDVFDWIEGDVQDGAVTLQGQVREPWRKNDYQRLAEAVPGVKSVANEIQVLPLSPFDDRLRLAAARSIYGDAFFARYANRALPPIHIIVENGKIILEGAVANSLERQLAETMVRSRVLSLGVVNHLTVDTETQSG